MTTQSPKSSAVGTKRLVLIDGKSVFYRGYYVMGPLALPDGTPTGGIYGFAAIAMEIVRKLNPTKVVVAWDSKSSVSKRRALYPEYKAGRVKPGDDFYAQIPLLQNLIADLGWSFVELDNYEADDIIGTLSYQADQIIDDHGHCEYETFIISSDLDMLQIVDENTHMWRILKGFSNIEQLDVAEVEAKYHIQKAQFLDFKALKGDASDNIPGVPGIGEKTASKLLNQYGSLDQIYQNLDQITGTTHNKLVAGKDSAYLSQKLARIMFDAPVELAKIPDFHFNYEKTIAGLKKLAFNSLIRKLSQQVGKLPESQKSSHSPAKATSPTIAEPDTPAASTTPIIPTTINPTSSTPTTFKTPDNLLIGWDIKTIMHNNSTIAKEILSGRPFWDLSQAAFLLNPLDPTPPTLSVPEDVYQSQKSQLEQNPELLSILTDFDLPLIPILYKMETKGMLIDRAYFTKLNREYSKDIEKLQQEIYHLAGHEFNLNSPYQLRDVLFEDLKLPTKGIKKTTRGYSTGASELEKLRDLHPIIDQIFAYRELSKLLSTYVIPMPDLADSNDRIHTTFTQNVTATGRLSSQNPNLQNIPVRTDEGKRIRTGFIAPKGKVLVSADYSQFELRLAAVLSNDQALIDDFNADVDIHTKTAAEAFHIPLDQVTKNQRRAAKVINFGILYGMSVPGLAKATGMTIYESKQFIDNYFKLRAPIKAKLESILKQARDEGYVKTFFGRRRPTPDIKSPNFLVRQAAARAAQNMPIQGAEADLMKRAMIHVDQKLPTGAELVMQVHDSLIVECDKSLTDTVSKILKHEMESVAPELKIKLAVEVTSGKNWGEL